MIHVCEPDTRTNKGETEPAEEETVAYKKPEFSLRYCQGESSISCDGTVRPCMRRRGPAAVER